MYRSGSKIGWGNPLHDHGPDPEEYFARTDTDASGSPEKRLRLAVLLNAIGELRRGSAHPTADEAVRWVRGELEAMHVSFSFAAICETLDIDREYLARALLGGHDTASLPRRQVRTQRLRGVPRQYRPRARAAAE